MLKVFICTVYVYMTIMLSLRCLWGSDSLQSEDDACFWFCFVTDWSFGSWTTNLQQGTLQTAGQTDWTHDEASAPTIETHIYSVQHVSPNCLSFPPEWRCAMSVITGLSTWAQPVLMDLPYAPCPWKSYSWSMTISSSELFYMSFATKGKKSALVSILIKNHTNVNHLWSFYRLGIWLFMSEMPYGTVSSSMLWKVLYFMQCAETAELEALSSTCDAHSCIMSLRGINAYSLNISFISSEILHAVFHPLLRPKRDICCQNTQETITFK